MSEPEHVQMFVAPMAQVSKKARSAVPHKIVTCNTCGCKCLLTLSSEQGALRLGLPLVFRCLDCTRPSDLSGPIGVPTQSELDDARRMGADAGARSPAELLLFQAAEVTKRAKDNALLDN